ncbi:hypothetical protein B566_EDAN013925 [Ephemera danica]|nr:hypothetical protein B566_EDAN013925 [Ephemera danica]
MVGNLLVGELGGGRGKTDGRSGKRRQAGRPWVKRSIAGVFGCGVAVQQNSENSNVTELKCNVRTLHDQVPNIASTNKLDRVSSVRVVCSDIVLFESSLNTGLLPTVLRSLLRKNATPLKLTLEQCQLRKIGTGLLSSLPGSPRFQSIAIRSSLARAGWSLGIEPGAFSGLPSLSELDLSASNIWAVPRDTLCSLSGLRMLNLTGNKIQDAAYLAKGPEAIPCVNCREEERTVISDDSVQPGSPRCLRSLEILDLSHNELTTLPDHFLSSLRSLRELKLGWNQLSSVGETSLAGLGSLQSLDLTGNKLSFLPPDWLADSPAITELRLADNAIAVLGPGLFSGLTQLLLLDLSHNDLSPGAVGLNRDTFRGLVRLVVLDLTANKLTRLDPTIFRDLYSLQVLRLAGNQLLSISDGTFASLDNLHALELSGNQLTELSPTVLSSLRALRRLSVSHNHLETLDKHALQNCSDLRELELSSNNFQVIHSEFLATVPRLESLDLSQNQLSALPNFPSLPALQVLRLASNHIASVTRDIFPKLSALRMLDMSGNGLSEVEPGTLNKNTKLEALRLDNNALTALGDALTGAPESLLFLNASDNQLQHFDFALLPGRVEWLDLHHNHLSRVRNHGGQGGHALNSLDLSENLLENLEAADVPDQLQRLYLNDNKIAQLAPNTFLAKRNLTVVDLAGNQLVGLDLAALQMGSSIPDDEALPEIFLARNPLVCDCELEWLQRVNVLAEKMRRHPRVADIGAVTCFLPHARVNSTPVPIVQLTPSQFLCPYEAHCFALCHCCDFSACDCKMTCPTNCTCYHDQIWSANVVDCSANMHNILPPRIPMDATQLFLDGNNLGDLSSHAFIGKRRLESLYLNASRITSIQNRTFNGLASLQTLHLQDNLLTELQGHEFFGLHRLTELYLENNAIIVINKEAFFGLTALRKIRLDGNRLVDFAPWNVLPGQEGNVRMSLGGNWWSCRNCAVMERLSTWTDSTSQMLCLDTQHRPNSRLNLSVANAIHKCGLTHHQNSATSASIQHDDYSDAISTSMLALVGLALVVLLVFVILAFAFRRRLILWAKNVIGQPAVSEVEETGKLYDAYIVYSPRDELIVTKEVCAKLETMGASLCLHHRDLPACHLSASVDSAIDASRRTIIVLSANFLDTEWHEANLRIPILDSFLVNNKLDKSTLSKLIIVILPSLNSLSPETNIPIQMWEPLHRLLNSANVLILNEKRHFSEELVRLMPSLSYLKKKNNSERGSLRIWREDNAKLYSQSPVYSSASVTPYWSTTTHLQPQQSGYMSSDGDDSCCQHTTSTDDAADSGESLCYSTYCQQAHGPHNHVYSTIDDNIRPASQQRMYFV